MFNITKYLANIGSGGDSRQHLSLFVHHYLKKNSDICAIKHKKLMAHVTKNDQMRYIEFNNFVSDCRNGDVLVLDHVNDVSPLYPQRPMTTIIVMGSEGFQELTANGRQFTINPGDVIISPPNVKVEAGKHSDDFECKILCLTDHFIQGLLHDHIDVWHHAVYVNQLSIVQMSDLCKEEFTFYYALIRSKLRNSRQSTPNEILQALLRALLLELSFVLESTSDMKKEPKLSQGKVLFNRFISLISNAEVKRQPILDYASQLAITPKYLTMLCLKYSDKTASEWVIQYTIEEIRFYLKSTDLSIKEISAKLGFSNMSHFGSYVRKHLGVSPSEFRYSRKL